MNTMALFLACIVACMHHTAYVCSARMRHIMHNTAGCNGDRLNYSGCVGHHKQRRQAQLHVTAASIVLPAVVNGALHLDLRFTSNTATEKRDQWCWPKYSRQVRDVFLRGGPLVCEHQHLHCITAMRYVTSIFTSITDDFAANPVSLGKPHGLQHLRCGHIARQAHYISRICFVLFF